MDQLFDFIKDYGGYAGAASVLGLAVLSLLYFAQAREVRRLREWAGRAPERSAELEQRVAEAARRPAPAVQRQPVPARQPGQPQTAAAQATARPAPANGQTGAAPATAVGAGAGGAAGAAAATAQTPGAPQAAATSPPATPGTGNGEAEGAAEAAKAAEAPKEGTPQDGATKPGTPAQTPPTSGTPPTTPAPTAPAAGATPPASGAKQSGQADLTVPPPVPPRTAAARPATPAPRPAAAPLRSGSASAARSRPATVQPQRTRSRRLPLILALAAVGVVLVGVALMLGGGDDGGSGSSAEPARTEPGVVPPPGEEPTSTGEARAPADTTVAVLNGTTIGGLAKRTGDELKEAGYTVGTIADAEAQNRSATLVQYAPDAKREAQTVAKIIGVGNDAVSPLDVNTRTVAGDNARVVVTVGADQNQQSGQG